MSDKRNLIRIIIAAVGFAVLLAFYHIAEESMAWWGWLIAFAVDYLIVGYDVVFRALRNIARGKVFDENFLMLVATVGAFCVSEFAEGVAVMLFYQVGELFQKYAVDKSRKSIAALMDICPQTACIVTDDGEKIVDPEEVEVGAIVIVRAGEKVPIDGEILDGAGALDCAALTGESVPVAVAAGDIALSGAIAVDGVLRIKTIKPYADSTVAKILELVENSSAKKAKAESFITRFAAVYTPAVVALAALIAVLPPLFIGYDSPDVWTTWVTRALTFLVVSCPCALVISVPMSFFGGIGGASRRGILVKGGNYLELLDRVDTIVFDKTGTITKGSFEVVDVRCVVGVGCEKILSVAAAVEGMSLHPVARSIVRAAERDGIAFCAADGAVEIAGRGITGTVNGAPAACGNARLMSERAVDIPETLITGAVGTIVFVAENGKLLGAIVIADAIKDDTVSAIAELKRSGVTTVMLTGDNRAVAERVAAEVGVDSVCAELLPDGKVAKLEEILAHRTGKRAGAVAFAGDGINDAPVLSRADVGIAMGALGSDAAIEAADIVLMNDKLSQIVTAKRIAEKTVRIVRQNIVFALGVKAVVLVLAAVGIASMWLAVFADVGVAVLAILNAMRALNSRD